MSTILAFLFTFSQTLAVVIGYVKPYPDVFDAFVTYGSPPAMVMGILNHDATTEKMGILFPLLILFHVIKYISLSRSQFVTDRPTLHYTSVLLELGYLASAVWFLF